MKSIWGVEHGDEVSKGFGPFARAAKKSMAIHGPKKELKPVTAAERQLLLSRAQGKVSKSNKFRRDEQGRFMKLPPSVRLVPLEEVEEEGEEE